MTLELSQVARLRHNQVASAYVGDLATEGCSYLKSSAVQVWITGERIRHIDETHPGTTDLEMISMAYGLRCGLMTGDIGRPNCLLVNYVHPDTGVRYKIAIKAANRGSELWVSTFHRLRQRQTRAMLKRGVIVRTHN